MFAAYFFNATGRADVSVAKFLNGKRSQPGSRSLRKRRIPNALCGPTVCSRFETSIKLERVKGNVAVWKDSAYESTEGKSVLTVHARTRRKFMITPTSP